MSEGLEGKPEAVSSLGIEPPRGSVAEIQQSWSLTAHNKKVLRGWETLCQQLPENAVRCYEWLRRHPTERIPGRCYQLKHKHYAGGWCFEIGSGQRIYYKLRPEHNDVLLYYAGPHPAKVPHPP